jgi:hypothetical protein
MAGEGEQTDTTHIAEMEQADETVSASEFINPTLRLWSGLINDSIITPIPSQVPGKQYTRPYTIDLPLIAERLDAVSQTHGERPTEAEAEELDSLTEIGRHVYPEVIEAFKRNEVLPDHLRNDLDKLITSDNIFADNWGAHQFYYRGGEAFPQEGEKKGLVIISPNVHESMRTGVNVMVKNTELSEPVKQRIALRWGIGHEIGHGIDKALRIRYLQRSLSADVHQDIARLLVKQQREIDSSIHNEIARDQELEELFADEDRDELHIGGMVSERIASGFENISLHASLTDAGVPDDEVAIAMQRYTMNRGKDCAEFVAFANQAKAHGFNLALLDQISTAISVQLSRERKDHYNISPEFELRPLGYAKPLSREQLQTYIGKYSS